MNNTIMIQYEKGDCMNETFILNVYHFVDKKSHLGMVIYARTREFAEKIISIHNICSSAHWVFKKTIFTQKIKTSMSPYDLELKQLEHAKKELQRRQVKYAKEERN